MNQTAAVQKRDRRVYVRRDKDFPIVQSISRYQFVTVEMVSEDAKRNIIAVRRRMLSLYRAGILNRARQDKFAPWVYFLSEKGASYAVNLGFQTQPHFIKSKSSILVPHDLAITQFHRILEKKLHETGHILTEWEQWRGTTGLEVETEDGVETLIPDARFRIDDQPYCYFEVMRSFESEYDNGESNLEKKIRLYNEYWKQSREEFYVLTIRNTKLQVANFLAKIEERFPYRRYWFTDAESAATKTLGKIWWTPKDYETKTYSLIMNED